MHKFLGPIMAGAVCALLATPAAAQETQINWATFWVGTNPLRPWGEALLDGYNAEHAGRYQIETEEIPGDKAYRDKMRADAVADALPDLITGNTALMKDLRDSGRVVNLMPYLEADPEWRDSFFDNAFDTYLTDGGELYALPYSRDYIGIFYNKAMFEQAGIEEFPRTWDAFFEACGTLSAAGFIPMATEGDWTTRLMWANMIGTQPGGAEWLSTAGGSGELELVGNAPVVAGTEMLRRMHEEGCTNEDAFTGQYATGATLFLQAEAAMIANGPWMIPNIKGVNTETAEGLGEDVDYAVSPGTEEGRGLIVVTGEAGFAIGAKDQDKIDGSVAFLKYLTSDEQMLNQAMMVSRFGPTRMQLTDEQRGQLEPMLLDIVAESEDVSFVYPHTNITMPTAIIQEFINSWPAYARGQIDTETFLEILEDAQ
ncbi:MAG: extracellular solute-binding protein [Roseitalea sp.]|nr:extracellular solute-binding protein [Roseitalea sp.]MBO6720824.1 extracellular solute-binding protein [Roseitalea sp.]MBO6743971.1 extracellular solute-binding protein [Roseitalea sp.]